MGPEGIIRYVLDTYVVARFAVVKRGLRVPSGKSLIIGQGAYVGGPLRGASHVHLMRGARVRGDVKAALDVVVGAGAAVDGNVEGGGNVILLEGARVRGSVRAAGLVRIVGGFVDGPVRSMGDVEVGGESILNEIHANGRIRTLPLGDSSTER